MDRQHQSWNSIVFTVPPAAAAQVRAWQQAVNHSLIGGMLAKQGEAMVTRLGRRARLQTITALPELGEAEPYMGDFGGLYTFTFGPRADYCQLHLIAASGAFRRAAMEPIPPLDIRLPSESVTLAATAAGYERDWSSPKLNKEGDRGFVHEVTLNELEFPIDGMMYRRLVAWGWDPLQIEAYRYVFVPLSVGCEMEVEHQPSGQKVHLTEGVGW